jgi:hypothetical protein
MKRPSLHKRMSTFTPKNIYEIDLYQFGKAAFYARNLQSYLSKPAHFKTAFYNRKSCSHNDASTTVNYARKMFTKPANGALYAAGAVKLRPFDR